MERKVKVWDRPYTVTIEQASKSVWIAVGDYEGNVIRTQDRSANTALLRWQEAARYRGN